MKKEIKGISNLFTRYLILVFIALPGFDIFYYVFLPLTTYPVFWIIGLFYNTLLSQNSIIVGKNLIEIAGACIAGSAYYFLLILNLGTPKIGLKKRINIILTSFGIFYATNLIRILILSFMFLEESSWFNLSHKVFWYAGSTVLVLAIWFLQVKIYHIKEIPFYSDLKKLYKKTKKK